MYYVFEPILLSNWKLSSSVELLFPASGITDLTGKNAQKLFVYSEKEMSHLELVSALRDFNISARKEF